MKKTLITMATLVALTPLSALAQHEGHDMKADLYDPKSEKNHLVVDINLLNEDQAKNMKIGEVVVTESKFGLVFTPIIKGQIAQGLHGFHIHVNPSCDNTEKGIGMAAGGHWDPKKTNRHSFPWDKNGHLGDLPALYVDANGVASNPVLAPKLKKLKEIKGHSLMIHIGGDNHHDQPAPLGGGGARVACGVIK